MIGRTISHYRITDKLGEGGMGVVYKAEDTNLKRPVALKFLAAHLLGDEDVKARFRREAEAAAALNHPNICHVYEISEVEGKTFIAMAFLEGEGLDKKIEAGPLKLKEALDIAIQVAQGLQAAHEKKIVHRDIKPANLMVSDSGSKQLVTIMDFGLAQLADRSKLTRTDETMGTVTYMSPEQTYGMDLDRRTDIWSLGVVIYEMVTGQQPFKGHYDKAVMYSITNEQPEPMTALRTGVPMELEWLVGKCLAKEATERYQSTADMVVDLEALRKKLESGKSTIMQAAPAGSVVTGTHAGPTQSPPQTESPSLPGPLAKYRVIEDGQETGDTIRYVAEDTELRRSVAIRVLPQSSEQQIERAQRRKQSIVLGVGALGVLLALIFAFFWLSSPRQIAENPVRRFSFSPKGLIDRGISISPDGKYVLYAAEAAAQSALWVRPLDSESARKLEGTEGAVRGAWSPDSKSIVFGTDRELKRISLDVGNPITLCELPGTSFSLLGASWSPDGNRIVFSSGLRLYEVAARGGEPKPLFEPEESEGRRFLWAPHFLPSSGASGGLVYTAALGTGDRRVELLDLNNGERRELGPGDVPRYSRSRHLIHGPSDRADTGLWALPFSLETLTATGEAFPIAVTGWYASVARDGTLVYLDSPQDILRKLVWRDRSGKILEAVGQPQEGIAAPSVSPDGRLLAVSALDGENEDIWIHDPVRGTKTRLTFDEGAKGEPTWSPSGREITYSWARDGGSRIASKAADGTGEATVLVDAQARVYNAHWSNDGKYLAYHEISTDARRNIWYLKPDGNGFEPTVFLRTPANEAAPRFSPDGRYLAYLSDESGRREAYVRPFPEGPGKWQVSVNGASQLRWRHDGRELFYVEESTLMAVSVSTEQGFILGKPERLFESEDLQRRAYAAPDYDVSADGQRFLTTAPADDENAAPPAIRVVQNWYEEFRDREQD
jgi:serine/threonine protein kinase/Tol biopolymer transport system component